MKNICALFLAGLVALGAHAQTVTPQHRQNALSSRDQARVEKLVCQPLGVAAIETVGARVPGAGDQATRAYVKCAPHVHAAGMAGGQRSICERSGKTWACKQDALYLRRPVGGQGPFEIAVQFMTFDQAQAAIACLEGALRDQPALLDSAPLTKVEFLLRAAPSDAVIVGLRSGSRCLSARLTLQCAVAPGRDSPVTVASCD